MGFFRKRKPPAAQLPPAVAPPTRPRAERDWRAYDSVAEAFDRFVAERLTGGPARDLVAAMRLEPGHRVLDVGTGTGAAAREAAATGAVVVGLDPSVPMLERAVARAGGPRYVAGEALDLPFKDASFDAVVASFVLAHFTRHETALYDLTRVLKPGGRFGCTTWADNDDEFQRAWTEIAERYVGVDLLRDAANRAVPGEERFAQPERLKEALRHAGLRDVDIRRNEYVSTHTRGEYIETFGSGARSRFMRDMLGEARFAAFLQDIERTFAARFPDRFTDRRYVLVTTARKP